MKYFNLLNFNLKYSCAEILMRTVGVKLYVEVTDSLFNPNSSAYTTLNKLFLS